MMRGAAASCLFVLICYITAGPECSGTSTEGMPTSQTLSVMSSSNTAPVADTTSSAAGSTSTTIIQSHASSLANGEMTPSSGSTPATDDVTSGSSPTSGGLTGGSSSASGGVTSGSSSASGGVTSGSSPASGGVTSGSSPASGGVTSGSSPASGGVTSGSSPASGGVTSGSSPASGGVTSGSSPASGGVTSGSSPASGGVTSGSSQASGGVTSGSSPASGGVTSGSKVTGGLMSSTSIANTAAPATTISIEVSASAKQNASTAETMTSAVNFTLVTTSSHVNLTNTMETAPTLTTILHTNEMGNATQTSTLKPPTIVTTPNNASSNLTTAGGPTNVTGLTIVTPNNKLSSTPVTVNVTVPVNVTVFSTKVSNSSATTQSPKSSTIQPPAQCSNAKCPPGSKCVNLYKSFICRCPLGQYVQGSNCVTVRIFPGILHLSNIAFTPGMNEINSKIFSETSAEIEEEMKGFFKNDHSYYKSIVWKLEKGSVKAFVENIFSSSSNVTEESVNQNIRTGIQNCSNCTIVSTSDNYAYESICSLNFCDAKTSKCKANNGIGVCNCLPGYYKFAVSDQSCKACPSGLKLQNGACVKCPFGYGGFNCDKSYLLALVVVSCVLGGILLLLLLTLMGTCLRLRSGAYSSSAGSHDYVMWPKSEMPKIPRATMHWDGNQLEMQENGSTSSLTDIHRDGGRMPEKNDDLKTFKGKQPSRYTYLCQGQENPYYVSDEKKPEYL